MSRTLSSFSSLPPLARALPLAFGLLLMAAEDECTIRIVTDDGDECEDVDEVCNLECELATNEDGCRICECADVEPPPPPPVGCQSDIDCGPGQACQIVDVCPPCAPPEDPNEPGVCECFVEGVCVDVQPNPCDEVACTPDSICVVDDFGQPVCIPVDGELCMSDADCGERAICDFSTCNGGARPDDPNGDPDQVVCLGQCRPVDEPPPPFGCEAVLCEEGTHCVEGFGGPICVPNESECNVDEDCVNADGSAGRCELLCLPIPGCPECDACMVVGQCVGDEPPPPPPDCTSDADCAEGARCNASEVCLSDPACEQADENGVVACDAVCWGYCVAPEPASCLADSDCAAGERCEVVESCPACDPNDPNGGDCFAPCFAEGRCVEA